ncbi:hypothetical protein HDV05_005959 [Chytridiales sp. JEL 0842]|nr:hypothetical protein HDV05_005959 [Chytridiales sp. JEL 0842]
MSILDIDKKKKNFRRYLENNGIIHALTHVLVELYEEPEKPENPIEYVRRLLVGTSDMDAAILQNENEELRRRVEELQHTYEEMLAARSQTTIEHSK